VKWNPSDAQSRQGIAITDLVISRLGHICRPQEQNDRGVDAHVELVEQGAREATGEIVALQVKSGPSYLDEKTATGFVHRGSLEHLDYWFNHRLPVFLVLVDTAKQKGFWQEVTEQTVERLAKGWKVEVPFANDLEATFITAARHRVGLDPASAHYTRLKLDDTGNGMTKRYAAHVLVRHPITRLRLEAVVRRAMAEIKSETFHRTTGLGGERFRDKQADVVSLYVAGDPDDATHANWLCRTMWVSSTLSPEVRPMSLGGVDLAEGLEVVWNSNYGSSGRFLKSLAIDKQTFLDSVRQLLVETERLIAETFGNGDKSIVDAPTVSRNVATMRRLYLDSTNLGLGPYECRDVAERFHDVMALADNAFMAADPARKGGEPTTAVNVLLELALKNCRKNVERLRYEMEKVT
jgi:hypothetical protein